ncbi:MAG TPA: hypothetical protein VLA98_04810 [Solirubrobacteraceae bacterium]|nr:hypothetical protein [Solirubrobacteraceae bacterium]
MSDGERPRPAPPSGMAPPVTAVLPGGGEADLLELARAICARYAAEYPDERERYGDAGQAWCVHDNQHLLNWAILDARGEVSLDEQVAWLGRVLAARDFPLDRLARDLDLGAAGDGAAVAAALERAAEGVRAGAG